MVHQDCLDHTIPRAQIVMICKNMVSDINVRVAFFARINIPASRNSQSYEKVLFLHGPSRLYSYAQKTFLSFVLVSWISILSNGRRIKRVLFYLKMISFGEVSYFIRSEMQSNFLLIFKLTDCKLSFLIRRSCNLLMMIHDRICLYEFT